MGKRDLFTKILAIIGTILVWIPIAAPLIFTFLRFMRSGRFLVDYLMPAELFPVIAVGTGLVLWAAIRAKTWIKWLVWSIVTILLTLGGGMLVARLSGLATGEIEPAGFWWGVVMGAIILYILAVVSIGVAGCYLTKELFSREPKN